MLLTQNTYKEQASLAQYCKTGDISVTGNVDKKRVTHYRRLVINVVKDSLSAAYPLTQDLLLDKEWDELTETFFANHVCQSPLIWKMPSELHTYIIETNHPLLQKYFVLKDLLWFEWLEIDMYMQEDINSNYSSLGTLQNDKLVLNPEHILEQFSYPVHIKKAKEISEDESGNYFLSLHRHPDSGKVLFTNLSAAFVRVIELLNESPLSVDELSERLSHEFNIKNTHSIREHLVGFLNTGLKNKLILGFAE